MSRREHSIHEETQLILPLATLLQQRGLRLVEQDQFIFPEVREAPHNAVEIPVSSVVYLQIRDAQNRVLAEDFYEHRLVKGQSPFIGPRAIPGSERARVLESLCKACIVKG